MQPLTFEWDLAKARTNVAKHGVTFEEATEAFEDPLALVQPDAVHPDRELLLGTSRRARLLLVVYLEKESEGVLRVAYEESR